MSSSRSGLARFFSSAHAAPAASVNSSSSAAESWIIPVSQCRRGAAPTFASEEVFFLYIIFFAGTPGENRTRCGRGATPWRRGEAAARSRSGDAADQPFHLGHDRRELGLGLGVAAQPAVLFLLHQAHGHVHVGVVLCLALGGVLLCVFLVGFVGFVL